MSAEQTKFGTVIIISNSMITNAGYEGFTIPSHEKIYFLKIYKRDYITLHTLHILQN